MKRDAPSWIDPDEDVVSVHDSQSDIEMVSAHEHDQQTEDSSPDSGTENSHHPSDDSNMESDQDQDSGRHSDSGSDPGSNLGSDPGSDAGSCSDYGADPESSDENRGDFTDMFAVKSVPVLPRDPSHGHLPVATADPGELRTRNDATFPLRKTLPIRTSRNGKKRNLIGRKLLLRPIPRRSPFRIK